MEQVNRDLVQALDLDLDVVDELEQIVQRLGFGGGGGQVTFEAVFAEGSFMRCFIKRGPVSREQTRELARRAK